MASVNDHIPLSPKMFHILLALADNPQNGYQVSVQVEENSQGRVRLSPATQYENLNRLTRRGLVEEVVDDPEHQPDGRGQRYWRLTDLGTLVLRAEVARLADDINVALANPVLRPKP